VAHVSAVCGGWEGAKQERGDNREGGSVLGGKGKVAWKYDRIEMDLWSAAVYDLERVEDEGMGVRM